MYRYKYVVVRRAYNITHARATKRVYTQGMRGITHTETRTHDMHAHGHRQLR